jgi:hypothetical protein
MWELTLRQTPARFEVFDHVFCLFERCDYGFVDLFLVSRLCLGKRIFLFGLALGEKFVFC